MAGKIKTIIVDDEPLARRNLRVLLERDPQIEVLEEHLIELVVVVLAGVDDDVIRVAIERGHDPREPDDLRPSTDNRGDPHLETGSGL